ncbi:hypothetical protein EDD22DRAFT_312064 [Suillus occidentalis]|nr:hypothetical protein EDD22DRAFT_312064 [Suillus occidentalis]
MGRKKKVEEEEVYHVEVITQARVSVEKDWEYYVKWAGYDSDADTWEPAKNVAQCERLLHSFWAHIGHDNKDYNVGHVFTAKDYWIKQEKEFFATQFAEDAKRQREMKKPSVKQATKATEPKQVESDTDSSEESDIPLKQLPPVAKTLTMRGQKRKNTLS